MSVLNQTNTTALILQLQKQLEQVTTGADIAWVNSCGYIIFFMQTGFCLLEAGSSRHKHHLHTVLLQVLNAIACVFGWWILGYAFGYGLDHSGFIGAFNFAGDQLIDDPHKMADWIFDMGSAATAAKIVSGAILERILPYTYLFFGVFMSAWIYPVGLHWAWHPNGWLKTMGYIDHAGSGVVHMVGGASALAACLVIGPRLFRFEKEDESEEDAKKRKFYNHKNYEGNFTPFVALGTLLLWYCWFGFNAGSSHGVVSNSTQDNSVLVGRAGINTTIATCAGGIAVLIIHYIVSKSNGNHEGRYNTGLVCNGLLGGAVGITAACGTVYPYAAFIIGFMAGCIYYFYQWAIEKLHIDDPLHAGPIHLGTGSWGVVAVGIFHKDQGFLYYGGGKLFGVQLLGMVCFFAWSFFQALIFFYLFKQFDMLRMEEEEEIKGDITQCGGPMINFDEESFKYYARLFRDAIGQHAATGSVDTNNQNHILVTENNLIPKTSTDRREQEMINVKTD